MEGFDDMEPENNFHRVKVSGDDLAGVRSLGLAFVL